MKKTANIFQKLPDASVDEVFEPIVTGKGLKIERIVSQGQRTPPGQWLKSPWSEWVLLLQGEAELVFFDGGPVVLKPGDHIHIPAHVKHRVEWVSPQKTVIWLAIHYAGPGTTRA